MRTRAVILAALLAALAGAGPARAGSYAVPACNAPGGHGVNAAWTLSYFSVGPAGTTALPGHFAHSPETSCPTTQGLVLRASPTRQLASSGETAAWTFRAPPGDAVTHITVWRYGTARSSQSNANRAQATYWQVLARGGTSAAGATVIGGTTGADFCRGSAASYPAFCTTGASGFSTRSRVDYPLPGFPVVAWGIECFAPVAPQHCATASPGGTPNATLSLQGATVTVSDPTPPSVAASGPLLAGGWRRPSDGVTVAASDTSGIRSLRLLVDGTTLRTVNEACDARRPAPCPTSATTALTPGSAADGQHTVTLQAIDSAGNVGRADRAVQFDSTPPAVDLLAVQGRRITAAVRDRISGVASGQIEVRDRPDAPWRALPTRLAGGRLTATAERDAHGLGVRIGAADAAGNFVLGAVTTMTLSARVSRHGHARRVRRGRVAVPYGRSVALSGRLATTDGVPLAHQRLAVTATLHRLRARAQRLATISTDASGRFRLRVGPGPSRVVSVGYAGGAGYLAHARVAALRVRATSSLHAAPRVLFGAGTVRFSGRLGLRGAHVPPSGKLVELQAFDAGRWRTFATARARGRHGTWHAANSFSGRPGRFPIRLRIRRESTFPYELGYSRRVVVVVR